MAGTGGSSSVFISYAREDDESFVHQLYRDLTMRGFDVWWDRETMESRGRTFLQELRDAIEEVDRVIFVVGPQAVVSHYCSVEVEHALLFGKGIIPILRFGDYSLLPPQLAKLDCPDFRQERPYQVALTELLTKPETEPSRTVDPAVPGTTRRPSACPPEGNYQQ